MPAKRQPDKPQEEVLTQRGSLSPDSANAIQHLKNQVAQGKAWDLALLEAASMWTQAMEERDGRVYLYLIGSEAFDWLLLAERLCSELDGMIPTAAREDLLFHGKLPHNLDAEALEKLLGLTKYRAYTNYWYGVVVEEAIQLAVEQEVQKEHRSRGRGSDDSHTEDIAWTRLYNDTPTVLLSRFRDALGYPQKDSISLTEKKEFTYWLFKLRVAAWDPARVASDTRKGLDRLDVLRKRPTED